MRLANTSKTASVSHTERESNRTSYVPRMAKGGPPDGVRYQDAYRFSAEVDGALVEGFVYKALPRRKSWEARIDGTNISIQGETRGEAVEAALHLV